jgi:hypothetical protein
MWKPLPRRRIGFGGWEVLAAPGHGPVIWAAEDAFGKVDGFSR